MITCRRFKCVDLDCDGVITPNEMQFFYEEQLHRMECMAQEPVLFEDIVCQMADMIGPAVRFRLRGLLLFRLQLLCLNNSVFWNLFFALICRKRAYWRFVTWSDANYLETFSTFSSISTSSSHLRLVIPSWSARYCFTPSIIIVSVDNTVSVDCNHLKVLNNLTLM